MRAKPADAARLAIEHLCVARVEVVLGLRGLRAVPGGNQRTVDDPRPAPDSRANAASFGVVVATIRCAADFEIWNTAASSRITRQRRTTAERVTRRTNMFGTYVPLWTYLRDTS